jgi:protein gp37
MASPTHSARIAPQAEPGFIFPDGATGSTDRTPPTLAELEGIIARGRDTFIAVGHALTVIRDQRLYRDAGYTNFDTYCHERWDFSRQRAHQLIQAARVSTTVDTPPVNEAQARVLARQRDGQRFSVAQWEALTPAERQTIIREAPLAGHSGFNHTNENIDWAHRSWNPVTGCDHGCPYCYARDIATRFYPQGFAPTFLPERLHAPRRMQVPATAAHDVGEKNVFVCSMADLFGRWVPQDWIEAVFTEVERAPDWNFLFLTKFPQRLAALRWPTNAWCGTSVDRQARVATAERAFADVQAGVKWLSCEPLLEPLHFGHLDRFDWVVIGAQSRSTQTPEFQPPWEWVADLQRQAQAAGCVVYIKPNLTSRPPAWRAYPGMPEVRS